jgi:RHS repeat-associated protein
MKHSVAWSVLMGFLGAGALGVGATAGAAGTATPPSVTLTVQQLLSNDRPGPSNELSQTLTVTGIRTTSATHGTATFANGAVTYTPDVGFTGSAVLYYTACDNGTTNGRPDPLCSETPITIIVVANRPPIANAQSLVTPEDSPLAVTLTATDPEGDPINYVIVTPPSHGALTGTPPAVTYVPAPNYHGGDSFWFAANDGQDQSFATAILLTVTEVNDPPVPQPDRSTVAAGKPATVPTSFLLANDVPGPADESGQTLTVTAATAGPDTHGTVSLVGGSVIYTPDAGFTGAAIIAYTVCDNGATAGLPDSRCADSTLTIVQNSAPVAKDQAAQTIRTTPLAIALSATDPENDTLTYAIVALPLHGTLTGTPPSVTYTASAAFVGTDTFTFTAADPYSTSNTATVTIVVKDLPPVVLGADSLSVVAGGTTLVNVLANDVPGTGTMSAATLAISSPPTKGVAAIESSQIRYTPNAGASGSDTFGYTACDTGGACGTALVTVTITVNHPPVAVADSYRMDAGTTLNVTAPGLLANDSDPDTGDTIQARLGTGVSAGNLLLRSDGSFTYTPAATFAGTDTFTYFVVDRGGLASAPVPVTISVIPAGPIAADDTYQTTTNNPLTVPPAGVLTNDTDPHATGLLTAKLDRQPFHGTLDLNSNGSFVYRPDPGFVGADSFRYFAIDLKGVSSASAFVTINVVAAAGPVPAVTCTAPADGGRVAAPVSVTATMAPPTGESISSWTVSARNLDRGTPVVLASGSGAPPATLATFDPTLLINGGYQILATAVSSGGGTTTCTTNVFVAGDMKLGDYQTTYLDMQTSIAGFPVQVLRTYDTKDTRQGDFGIGWRLELAGPRVTPNGKLGQGGWSTTSCGFLGGSRCFQTATPHFVTVTSPGGRVEVFDLTPPQTSPLLAITTSAYTARPGTGTTSTLEDVDAPTLQSAGDSLTVFLDGSLYDPVHFRLTTKDGIVMLIDRYAGLQSMKDRNGNAITFSANGITSSSTTRNLAFVRDGAGRITEIDGPAGKRTNYSYSAVGDLSTFTDAAGATSAFAYNTAHRLLSIDGPGGTRLWTLNYDADGRVVSLTDGTGRTTAVSSNVNARSTIVTSPSGRLTTLTTYGADGYPATVEEAFDGHSRVTSYQYDSEGRVIRTTKPLGRVETLTYDAAGNLTSRTTPKNETWTYAYNALNELTMTTAPDGSVNESYVYDALGNLTSATLRNGSVVAYTNDSRGLPVTLSDSFGSTVLAYDADQQIVSATDSAGGITRRTYDGSGHLLSVQNPAGETTSMVWDAVGHLVESSVANGTSYTLTYDALGRSTSLTDTGGRTSTYQYDAADRIVTSVDRMNLATVYTYDADGNLATRSFADGDIESYKVDAVGRLVSASNSGTTVEFGYNDADDRVSERTSGSNGVALPDVTLAYTTDPDGHRTGVSGPSGSIAYGYDSNGRLSTVRDDIGGLFSLTFDAANRLTGLSRPNGVNDALAYRESLLASRNASLGGALRARTDYTLDLLGRRATLTDLDGSHSFTYDLANRLTSATHPSASGLPTESFTYDAVDNRTSWTGSPPGSVSYDTAMQLSHDATYDYSYDAEGRLTQRTNRTTADVTTYTWNAAGRLTSITTTGGGTSTYRYDVFGRRLEAIDNGAIRRFVYSGWNLQDEFDGSNALRAAYVSGTDPYAPAYEIVRDGARYYALLDGVGSVTTLTDATGAAVGHIRYSAFGAPQTSGVTDAGFTFTGHQYDSVTGLIYARERYYDPAIGRFLSQDPEFAVNPYSYAFDAPLDYTDPSGRATTERSVQETRIAEIEQEIAGNAKYKNLPSNYRPRAIRLDAERAYAEEVRREALRFDVSGRATPQPYRYRPGG